MVKIVMKTIIYSLLVLLQSAFVFGSLVVQNKCWLWDSTCLTATAQTIVPAFTAGIPELGIEPLDTMVLDSLNIDKDGVKTNWSTITIKGLKNAVIDKISFDLDTNLMRLMFRANYFLKGNYTLGGNLLSLAIDGTGEVNMDLYNVQMDMFIPFEIIKDLHVREVMHLKDFQYLYEAQRVSVYFDNLYNGDIKLAQRMNNLINMNWKELTTNFGRYLFDMTNKKIFDAIRTYLHLQPLETICLY